MSKGLQGMIAALVAVAFVSIAAPAEAQVRWGVSIGSGGGVRVGVGNGMYGYGPRYYGAGPGYGPGYGYGPGVVIGARPVYGPQPVYVNPQPQLGPTPIVQPNYPVPASGADGGEILLFSPNTNTGDIRYLLNGQLYTMPPGTKQSFVNDRTWTIQFESAAGQVTSYTLETGRYKFKSVNTGVGLFQTKDLPDAPAATGLPPAPIPNPPEADPETTVIPSRPALKATP